VPGAMLSVVCNNELNRAVREFKLDKPSDILDKVRSLILNEFESEDDDFYDGMDISLCALNTETNELNWSGANRPIWILNTEGTQIEEIKGDKQPIGSFLDKKPFTNHTLELKPGETIYVFSDGYADQFGGEFKKKMMTKNFKKQILSIANLSMEMQQKALKNHFFNWKGEHNQIDDVCVIGVKV
jgi:serine phosphatase RsbU (regulator of sigma subunit)